MSFMNRDRIRELSSEASFGRYAFVSDTRIQGLADRIAAGGSAKLTQKWDDVRISTPTYPVENIPDHWFVYNGYGTEEERSYNDAFLGKVETDFKTAVDLALQYRVTGIESYAEKTADLVSGWSQISTWDTNNGSLLQWADHWPLIIQAALLIRDSPAYTLPIHSAFQTTTNNMAADLLRPNGYTGSPSTALTNHASIHICAQFAVAVLLEDYSFFRQAVYRWRQQFNDSVVSNFFGVDGEYHDNVQHLEVYREGGGYGDGSYGLLYSNYDFGAKMSSAEWARLNGEWLYDHVAPDGSSLEGLFGQITLYNRYPNAEYLWFNTSDPPSRFYAYQFPPGFDAGHVLWGTEESQYLIDVKRVGTTSGSGDQDFHCMRATDLLFRGQPLYG